MSMASIPAGEPGRAGPGTAARATAPFGAAGALLLLVGGLLCSAALSGTEIFRDEANTLAIASATTFGETLAHLAADGNAPLHAVLLRAVFLATGPSDAAAQWLSVAFALGACVALYRWCALASGVVAGRVALACAVFATPWLEAAIQVRPYALLILLTTLSLWCWQDLLFARGRRGRRAFALGACVAAALYAHPWAAFSAGAMGVLSIAAALFGRGEERRGALASLFALAAAALAWSPQLAIQLRQAGQNLAPWSGPASFGSAVLLLRSNLDSLQALAGIALLDAGLAASRATAKGRSPSGPGSRGGESALVGLWALATLGLAMGASQVATCWAARYGVLLAPALWFLLGTWGARMWTGRGGLPRRGARAALLAGLALAAGFAAVKVATGGERKSNAREVVGYIREHLRPNDLVVVSSFAHAPAIAHYLPAEVPLLAYPRGDRGAITRWTGIEAEILDPRSLSRFEDTLSGAIWPGMRVWVVDPFRSTLLGCLVAMDWLPPPSGARRFNYAEALRATQVERWVRARGRVLGVRFQEPSRWIGEHFTLTLVAIERMEETTP
jgi:hypothetical protein